MALGVRAVRRSDTLSRRAFRLYRESTYPDARRFHHDDRSGLEVREHRLEIRKQQASLSRRAAVGFPAQEDHRWKCRSRPGEQLAEVSVCRDQCSAVSPRSLKDDPIGRAHKPETSNVDRVVSSLFEQIAEEMRKVLVEQKSQAFVRRGNSRSVTASAA